MTRFKIISGQYYENPFFFSLFPPLKCSFMQEKQIFFFKKWLGKILQNSFFIYNNNNKEKTESKTSALECC